MHINMCCLPECQECQWESQVLGVQYGEFNIATLNLPHGLFFCAQNLPHGQDQMFCLIDFAGFKLGNLWIRVTKMMTNVLQGHYPKILDVAIIYDALNFVGW